MGLPILNSVFNLKAVNLGKKFGQRSVFSQINLDLNTGNSLAVIGPNGSGKSTLLKILVRLIRPSSGDVLYTEGGNILGEDTLRGQVSFVAPYLNLYDQLTGEENIQFFTSVRGGNVTGKEIEQYLTQVGLERRGLDLVSTYSTGMKQRLKYAVALANRPNFLILDEPMSGLDDSGKSIVTRIIDSFRTDSIILLASNEKEEYALARQECRLGQ